MRICTVDSCDRLRAYPFSRSWKNELEKLAREGRNPLHLAIPRLNFYIAFIQMGLHFLIIAANSFRKLVKIDSNFRNMCLSLRHVYLVELVSRVKSHNFPNYWLNKLTLTNRLKFKLSHWSGNIRIWCLFVRFWRKRKLLPFYYRLTNKKFYEDKSLVPSKSVFDSRLRIRPPNPGRSTNPKATSAVLWRHMSLRRLTAKEGDRTCTKRDNRIRHGHWKRTWGEYRSGKKPFNPFSYNCSNFTSTSVLE